MSKAHNDESIGRVDTDKDSVPEIKGISQHPFVTSGLELERNLQEKTVRWILFSVAIFLGCLIYSLVPPSPEMDIYFKAFVITLLSVLSISILKAAVVLWIKEDTVIFKKGVDSKISAAELRKRWGREVSHDFLNVVFETKLNVYLRSEVEVERILIVKSFYSQFFPNKDRVAKLFNERCFFDFDEVMRAEEAFPRLKLGDYAAIDKLKLKIEKLEKELKDSRTLKARLTVAQNKLAGSRKEGFFFANMMLEMVKDPVSQKQFTADEYKVIADKVRDKDYIKKLEMVRPADSVIKEFRDNLPTDFRNESNTAK
ncbi:hypothetical protein [Maridesulfovibrio sp.]|uniref:hypothetical protein n=1 Tax=Maridesulfovibrio sp. TaxID=2795000 RepID=UPI002A18ACBF|nr:hypothetical protein [Maridesulfovibrio sp.]